MTAFDTRRVSVRGLGVAYHCFGDRSAQPIVALHGFMDHGLSFAPMVRALAEPFFVVAIDHRGHGFSDWVGDGGYYYFPDYFQDVLAVADDLGLDRFGLIGHSMGGGVATGVASLVADRIDAVVLIEGMGPPFDEPGTSMRRTADWLETLRNPSAKGSVDARRGMRPKMASLEEAEARLRRANPRLDPAIAAELAQTFSEPFDGGVAWRFDPLHRTKSPKPYLREEAEAMWRSLSMPVLSMHGTESAWTFIDVRERHALLPRGRAIDIEGAGHNIHHERPALVAHLTAAFMRGRLDALPAGVRAA